MFYKKKYENSLIDFLIEIKKINLKDKKSTSYISWSNAIVSKDYNGADFIIKKLLESNNFDLYKSLLRRIDKFNKDLFFLKNVPGNRYFSYLVLHDYLQENKKIKVFQEYNFCRFIEEILIFNYKRFLKDFTIHKKNFQRQEIENIYGSISKNIYTFTCR